MKRLIIAVVILAVIVVMALRGCPRVRRSAGITEIVSVGYDILKPDAYISERGVQLGFKACHFFTGESFFDGSH